MKAPLIDIRPDHWKIVRDILQEHVPRHEVWAFGSRAKWTAKEYSDLDLAVITDQPLSLSVSASLSDDFSESDLPWKVDVVDWATTGESFRKIIRRDKVVVQKASADPRAGMAGEWIDTTIGEQATLQRGIDITKADQRSGPVPVISSGGVSSFHDTAAALGPGVVLGRKGVVGSVYFVSSDYWPHDTTLWVKDFHGNNPRFVYYFFKWMAPRIATMDVGSANPTLNRNHVHPIQIRWPPPLEQRAIADVLGTLDDKIELNRRMNETLEAIARALFKSWFVDFDPVRAKAEGRNPGLPQPLADLFPDSFEDSELGEIPKGWEVGTIYKIADVVYGAPFASSQFNTEGLGKPLIRIRDLANESPGVWTPEVHPKGYVVRPGDVVVGMDGEFRAYLWGGAEAWLNQRVCVFVPKGSASAAFVRNSIIEPLAHIEATETATTVIHLGKGDIDRFVVVVPSDEVLAAFNAHCQPWYERIVAGKLDSRTLAALRDTLLPKLISGELRVRDAERFVGKVA